MEMLLISVASIAMLMGSALATNHTVGGPTGGWDLLTDLQAWASSVTFQQGDNLVFLYAPIHNVLEVSKADFDSCNPANAVSASSGGFTIVKLTTPGKKYFICGTVGHCARGMKVEIEVVASAVPLPSPSTTPAPAPSPSPETRWAAPHSEPVSAPVWSPSHSPKHAPAYSPKKAPAPAPSKPRAKAPSKAATAPSEAPSNPPEGSPAPAHAPSTAAANVNLLAFSTLGFILASSTMLLTI